MKQITIVCMGMIMGAGALYITKQQNQNVKPEYILEAISSDSVKVFNPRTGVVSVTSFEGIRNVVITDNL